MKATTLSVVPITCALRSIALYRKEVVMARRHQLNVILSDSERDRVLALGTRLGLDRTDVVRTALASLAFATFGRDGAGK